MKFFRVARAIFLRRRRRPEILSDPWSGAIVKERKYFITNWTAAVGRTLRYG